MDIIKTLERQPRIEPFPKFDVLEVSHSSRGSLRSCPRKFAFRKMYASSRRDESRATGSGKALHNAFQNYFVNRDDNAGLLELILSYPIQYQESAMDANSLEGCIGTYLKCIESDIFEEWEIAYVVKPDGEKVPAVEVPFSLNLQVDFFGTGELVTIKYIGYIDLILYNRLTNQYAVVDIKTSTKDSDFATEYTFHEQCLPYGLVLQALLGLDYERGFEVGYWITKVHAMQPWDQMLTFMKDGTMVAEWIRGYLLDIAAIQQFWQLGFFPRNGNACYNWNRRCTFFDLCDSRDYNYLDVMIGAENEELAGSDREEPWVQIDLGVIE